MFKIYAILRARGELQQLLMCEAEMKPEGKKSWRPQITVDHMVVICYLTVGYMQSCEEVVVGIWLQDARRGLLFSWTRNLSLMLMSIKGLIKYSLEFGQRM